MKKISILLSALLAGATSFAQIANAGMETWRNNSSGTTAIAVHAPTQWYGFDSLVISLGETYGPFIGAHGNFHAQLFQESTIKNSGSYSAKVMTRKQDTLGLIAGSLSNSVASVNALAIIGGGSIASATTFSGGAAVTERVTSVSAYVEYLPGIDSATGMWGGRDTALLTVQALGHRHGGSDTLVGNGIVQILPASSFHQVTANMVYFDTVNYYIDTVRIIFSSSSGGRSKPCDSSTLYVDDVSMTTTPNPAAFTGVQTISANNEVSVYPNPASDVVYIASRGQAIFTLYTMTGKMVITKNISGSDRIDVSKLPAGMYSYIVRDNGNNILRRGAITVSR